MEEKVKPLEIDLGNKSLEDLLIQDYHRLRANLDNINQEIEKFDEKLHQLNEDK